MVSGKLEFKVCVTPLLFDSKDSHSLNPLLGDHIAALASLSLKSHLRDWQTGVSAHVVSKAAVPTQLYF